MFKVGDRVVLLPGHPYIAGPNNPDVGTRFFSEGTVESVKGEILWIRWDKTGEINTYAKHEYLELVYTENDILPQPNLIK